MHVHVKKTAFALLTLSLFAGLWACHSGSNSNHNDLGDLSDTADADGQINPNQGSQGSALPAESTTLAFTSEAGDQFELTIPAYTWLTTQELSLELGAGFDSPYQALVLPEISIGPAIESTGIEPMQLSIRFAQAPAAPLIVINQDGLPLPHKLDGDSLVVELWKGQRLAVAAPTLDEATAAADALMSRYEIAKRSAGECNRLREKAKALWAQAELLQGLDPQGQAAEDSTSSTLQQATEAMTLESLQALLAQSPSPLLDGYCPSDALNEHFHCLSMHAYLLELIGYGGELDPLAEIQELVAQAQAQWRELEAPTDACLEGSGRDYLDCGQRLAALSELLGVEGAEDAIIQKIIAYQEAMAQLAMDRPENCQAYIDCLSMHHQALQALNSEIALLVESKMAEVLAECFDPGQCQLMWQAELSFSIANDQESLCAGSASWGPFPIYIEDADPEANDLYICMDEPYWSADFGGISYDYFSPTMTPDSLSGSGSNCEPEQANSSLRVVRDSYEPEGAFIELNVVLGEMGLSELSGLSSLEIYQHIVNREAIELTDEETQTVLRLSPIE